MVYRASSSDKDDFQDFLEDFQNFVEPDEFDAWLELDRFLDDEIQHDSQPFGNPKKRALIEDVTSISTSTSSSVDQPNSKLQRTLPEVSLSSPSSGISSDAIVDNTIKEERILELRLETFDPIVDAFNMYDVDQLYKLMHNSCHKEIHMTSSSFKTTFPSINSVFAFWFLAHESYPDAMIKVLEKRIKSARAPGGKSVDAPKVQDVEYVYKFTGSRITTKQLVDIYQDLLFNYQGNFADLSYDEVMSVLVRYVTNGGLPPAPYGLDLVQSLILEAVLTFDTETNLITNWNFEVLAG